MNKKIIVKPVDNITEVELRRLESELSTIGGFDFITQKSMPRTEECTSDSTQSKAKVETSTENPFAGISPKDIKDYSGMFNVKLPENDNEVRKLVSDIRKWISEGRPKSKLETKKPLPSTNGKIKEG